MTDQTKGSSFSPVKSNLNMNFSGTQYHKPITNKKKFQKIKK